MSRGGGYDVTTAIDPACCGGIRTAAVRSRVQRAERAEQRRPSSRRCEMQRSREKRRRLRDGGGIGEGVLVYCACGYYFLSSVIFSHSPPVAGAGLAKRRAALPPSGARAGPRPESDGENAPSPSPTRKRTFWAHRGEPSPVRRTGRRGAALLASLLFASAPAPAKSEREDLLSSRKNNHTHSTPTHLPHCRRHPAVAAASRYSAASLGAATTVVAAPSSLLPSGSRRSTPDRSRS